MCTSRKGAPRVRNLRRSRGVVRYNKRRKKMLKGIVLWAMGVPIFVIILLYMFVF
ncbi:hypothetical protein REJC140_02507 [Pseudorhizobium endolithicum]|uniref:Sugar ABC transporter permease n=1 Tax=Pseudorhizobium endolithicum TaxID=1191678 RepID=A0ABM8PFR0_9HYPH|nr:hypothetical protein REQ54_02200 [Rhizobium sp. Q54]CAD7027483.1 hypothetical protein REJC140_02507 [Pseudorhizobium endolithicum]